MVVKNVHDDRLVIELSPNRSASWQQTKWIIAVMLAIVMVIALAWSFVGAWVVLPFAGFEIGLFAYLMYKVSHFTYSKQVVFVGPSEVIVEQGHPKRRVRRVITKNNLHVAYWESERDWELPRVALKNDFDEFELGNFLNLDDRRKLKTILEDAGFIVLRNRWWQK